MSLIKQLLFLVVFLGSHNSYCATLIFDLGEVLLTKSSTSVYWQIGLSKFFGLYNPFNLEKTLFKFLDMLEPRKPETPLAMHNNILLPQIMCDWLAGKKSSTEILETIELGLKKHKNIFSSYSQQRVVGAIARFMFTPQKFTNAICIIPQGFRLVKKCYQQRDECGNRKNKIYILSNWDAESFELLVKKNKKVQELLQYCDGIVISGHAHSIKPDSAIFHHLFSLFNIDPDKELTIFIDDQFINIQAARNLNKKKLYALQCKNQHFKSIKKKLKELEVL